MGAIRDKKATASATQEPLSGGRLRCGIFPDNGIVSQAGNTRGNNNAKEARGNRLVGPSRLVLPPRVFLLGLLCSFIPPRLGIPHFPSPVSPLSDVSFTSSRAIFMEKKLLWNTELHELLSNERMLISFSSDCFILYLRSVFQGSLFTDMSIIF